MPSKWAVAAIIIYHRYAVCLFKMYHIFLDILREWERKKERTNKIKHLCVSGCHCAFRHSFPLCVERSESQQLCWINCGACACKRTIFNAENIRIGRIAKGVSRRVHTYLIYTFHCIDFAFSNNNYFVEEIIMFYCIDDLCSISRILNSSF